MNILFLAKHKPFSEQAADLINRHVKEADIIYGDIGDMFPAHVLAKKYDYVFSYISPWIVPKQVLENTKKGAINFHPGSPAYPGIGCTNFAIYNGEKKFGVTTHYMVEKVDCGNIIAVESFPVFDKDTVYSLTQRCYAYIFIAFTKIFHLILSGQELPLSSLAWQRKPYKREELNALCRLTKDMSEDEIQRRIKATTYPNMPGAYWKESGQKVEVNML